MGRAHVTVGIVTLLLLMLAIGGLILWYLQNWGRQLSRVEERLGSFQPDSTLPKTGLKELDRLIASVSGLPDSYDSAP